MELSGKQSQAIASRKPIPLISLPILVLIFSSQFVTYVDAHGFMVFPNQRGALSPRTPYLINHIQGAKKSDVDWFMHFPSGDKSTVPGSARRYQVRQAGSAGWVPYNPFDPNFKFRAGLCGDAVGGTEHRKGGKFYDNARISAEFIQGSVIDVSIGIIAHHNGFMELYLCDAGKCGGDISHKCFLEGHCTKLERAVNKECDSGQSKKCGPIDPSYPGRWYLPCRSNGTPTKSGKRRFVMFGPGTMKYQLPSNVTCEHCVLQWYWASGDKCNPPGLKEYFEGKLGPKNWGTCPGPAKAVGGYVRRTKTCGRVRLAEEYYQCSDIRINPSPLSTLNPSPNKELTAPPVEAPTTLLTGDEYTPLDDDNGAMPGTIPLAMGNPM